MENQVMKVKMFRNFEITYQNETVDVSKYLGKQLVNLLQVLMIQNEQEVPRDALIDILWTENDDPRNVMKFTIFRLRKDLAKIKVFEDVDFIQTTKNGYRLNPEIQYKTDFQAFAKIWEKLEHKDEFDDKDIKEGKKMLELYNGKLYLTNSPSLWISQLCEYYRSCYANCVIKICKHLLAKQEYDEMLSINYKAILTEPFYEGLHYYYMKGLIETRDYHKALKYYDDINEAFYKELGTGLSQRFKELYNVIVEDNEKEVRLSIKELHDDLNKKQKEKGGFYCTYDMFKYIYELNTKTAKREDKKYFLILFDMSAGINIDKQTPVMNKLKDIVSVSLRNNDVFARVNNSQFIVLVECKELENVYLIIQRVSSKFYKKFSSNKYRLTYNVKETLEATLEGDL